jgi:hypothetical protein
VSRKRRHQKARFYGQLTFYKQIKIFTIIMKLSTVMLLGASLLTSGSAWMTSPAKRTETRLMSSRRSFFGAIVSSTTIVAGPWIAFANEEEELVESVDQIKDEPILLAEELPVESFAGADEPSIVEVVDKHENQDIIEVSTNDQEEVAIDLDAKIEESIEAVEAMEVVSEPEVVAAKDEETFVATVATVDKTKTFQDLFDERKSIESDEDLEAFRSKLQARITADPSFVEEFESFLDSMTLASV